MTPRPWIYENRNGDDPRNTCNGWGTVGLWGSDNSLIFGNDQGWERGFKEPEDQDDIRILEMAPDMHAALWKIINSNTSDPERLRDYAREVLNKLNGAKP
jgi:hypothetical protein